MVRYALNLQGSVVFHTAESTFYHLLMQDDRKEVIAKLSHVSRPFLTGEGLLWLTSTQSLANRLERMLLLPTDNEQEVALPNPK